MKQLESRFADYIPLYIDLKALTSPLQMRKTRFSHEPRRDDAAGNPHFALVCFQFRPAGLPILLDERGGGIRPAKFAGIRIVSQRLNLFEFLLALFKLVARLKLQRENPFGNDGV